MACSPMAPARATTSILAEQAVPENLFRHDDTSETLDGVLQHVVYTSPDTGWTVARLEVERDAVTVVGNLAGVQPGESLRVSGRWIDDRRYGRQFRVESFLNVQPSTLVGIEKYLGSGLVRGIGPVMAHKLVEHFGIDTLRVIDEEMTRLREVPGIGRTRVAAIRSAWREQRGIRDVMVFLQAHGISAAHAARIYKRYGARAIAVVKENPYRLARDVAGIGFLSADRIAMALGIAADSPRRIEAGVLHALEQAAEEGHCFLPRERLVQVASALLAGVLGSASLRLALSAVIRGQDDLAGRANRGELAASATRLAMSAVQTLAA